MTGLPGYVSTIYSLYALFVSCRTVINQTMGMGVEWLGFGWFSYVTGLYYHTKMLNEEWEIIPCQSLIMMTSSNGNMFRVTGLCVGISSVTVEFPSQRPLTRRFDVFFDLRLNKRLSKQSGRRCFETPSRSFWCHCNDSVGLSQLCLQMLWCLPAAFVMGLLPDTQNCELRMRRERFPRHSGLAIPTCITARAWRTCRDACRDRLLAVSFEVGGGENIPGACATPPPPLYVSGKRSMNIVPADGIALFPASISAVKIMAVWAVYMWRTGRRKGDRPENELIIMKSSVWSFLYAQHHAAKWHMCVSSLSHNWFRWWLVVYSTRIHYLNQYREHSSIKWISTRTTRTPAFWDSPP